MRAYQIRRIEASPGSLPPDRLIGASHVSRSKEDVVVTARTAWAFADVSRGRPVRIPQALLDDFLVRDG